jgi:hypothetical protein
MSNPYQSPDLDDATDSSGFCCKVVSRLGWRELLRFAFSIGFFALMAYEWNRWPNGNVLLGPLGLIWYNGLEIETLVLSGASMGAVLAFVVKPHFICATVSILGVLNWFFWGLMVQGIDV